MHVAGTQEWPLALCHLREGYLREIVQDLTVPLERMHRRRGRRVRSLPAHPIICLCKLLQLLLDLTLDLALQGRSTRAVA